MIFGLNKKAKKNFEIQAKNMYNTAVVGKIWVMRCLAILTILAILMKIEMCTYQGCMSKS
jgi:hypothetical protein